MFLFGFCVNYNVFPFVMWFLLDYGDKDNEDLRERFEVKKEDYPVFKLFKQGQKETVDFTQSVTSEDLSRFVKLEAGLWLGKILTCFSPAVRMFLKSISCRKADSKIV